MGYLVFNVVFLVRTINIFSRCDLCGLIANSRFSLHVTRSWCYCLVDSSFYEKRRCYGDSNGLTRLLLHRGIVGWPWVVAAEELREAFIRIINFLFKDIALKLDI